MTIRAAKVTISLSKRLLESADEIARGENIYRSEVFTRALELLIRKYKERPLIEHYKKISIEYGSGDKESAKVIQNITSF